MPSFCPLITAADPAFRAIADELPTGIAIFDASGARTYANPRALELLGDGQEEWSFPQERDEFTRELRVGDRWVVARATPTADAWLIVLEDHTEFRLLAESSIDMICRLDVEGNYRYVSPASRHLLGYEPEELVGRSGLGLVHPDDVMRISTEGEAIIGTDVALEMRLRHKDGSWVWTESMAKLVESSDGVEIHSANRGIDDRKRAEEALRVSEARFRSAFEDAVVGLCVTGFDGCILRVNQAMCELLDRPEEDVVGLTFSDLTHPDDVEIGRGFVEPMVAGKIRGARFEKRYLRPDGSAVEAEVSVTMLRDGTGRPQSFLTYALDLSERKLAERAAESLMNDFLALASHELAQLLLTSISGWTSSCCSMARTRATRRSAVTSSRSSSATSGGCSGWSATSCSPRSSRRAGCRSRSAAPT